MAGRKKVYAVAYDGNMPTSNLIGAIDWLQTMLDAIPEESRPSAEFDIYEDQIIISYRRFETAEEVAERHAREAEAEKQRQEMLARAAVYQEQEICKRRAVDLSMLEGLMLRYPEQAKVLLQSMQDPSASEPSGG